MGGACSTHSPPTATAEAMGFRRILDQYESIDEVQQGLRKSGLESSQLVLGIDFTKSNEWSGKYSFGGKCLHASDGQNPNPYEQAMSIVAKTLAVFDDDDLIPCYGFGDHSTADRAVFSFFPRDRPANGLEGALFRYQQISPLIKLAGPTSFAPLIRQGMKLVVESGMQYHILVIIADGQVTPSCMKATVTAIVDASKLPLSIVMVGVGDGPWDQMEDFDDKLPQRKFDNFQFVNFGQVMQQASVYDKIEKIESHFAVHALMEIPEQYSIIQQLGLMSGRVQPDHEQWVQNPPTSVMNADRDQHVPHNWLFAYRLLVLTFTTVFTIVHTVVKGLRPMKFYTKWNFTILTLYFALVVWETIWFRRRRALDHEHPFGIASYLAIILYHINMTTVWTVDVGTWGVLYPLYRNHPAVCRQFLLNFFSYVEHIGNWFLMLGEMMMNRMPFFEHLRGTVGLWVAAYAFYGFLYRLRTGLWVYPVSKTTEIWSPIAYGLIYIGHVWAFKLFQLFHRVKVRMLESQKKVSYD